MTEKPKMQANASSDKDRTFLNDYFALYRRLLLTTQITDQLLAFRDICLEVKARGKKLIFAGNGASASIASHAATLYTQHGGVRSIAFNDHNLITAFGNDYGYEHWLVRALEAYADPGDVVVLISSSGTSQNIVNAAKYASDHGLQCVTFSGFSADNSVRALGYLSFWVDCNAYNIVECIHLIWILLVVNLLVNKKENGVYVDRAFRIIMDHLTNREQCARLIAFRDTCRDVKLRSGKVIFVGNGGGSSIASHAATDFTKQSRVRSIAFNDHNLLTCFANDYGQEHWIARAVEAYAGPEDALVLISPSGRSANVLNAADLAKYKGLPIITFTALERANPLRELGNVNFWVDSCNSSIAEGIFSVCIFTVADLIAA